MIELCRRQLNLAEGLIAEEVDELADFAKTDIAIPWLADKKLRFAFG